MAGRAVQEKTFAQLKREFALEAVPIYHYAAYRVWQQLSILAHNLSVGFQLAANLAGRKLRSPKTRLCRQTVELENSTLLPHSPCRTLGAKPSEIYSRASSTTSSVISSSVIPRMPRST